MDEPRLIAQAPVQAALEPRPTYRAIYLLTYIILYAKLILKVLPVPPTCMEIGRHCWIRRDYSRWYGTLRVERPSLANELTGVPSWGIFTMGWCSRAVPNRSLCAQSPPEVSANK